MFNSWLKQDKVATRTSERTVFKYYKQKELGYTATEITFHNTLL
jgi:hypothetical protein